MALERAQKIWAKLSELVLAAELLGVLANINLDLVASLPGEKSAGDFVKVQAEASVTWV